MKKMGDFRNAKRVGVMGGAFDPVHHGHLNVAECVRHEFQLDFVLFIPTGQPSHKVTQTFNEHRYLMTVLACNNNPHFHVSRMELERPGFSYTIDTIRLLKEQTTAELYFIVGADEMLKLDEWKDAKELVNLCKWVAVRRPGHAEIRSHLEIPGLDISGTAIRERIEKNQPIRYLLPDTVIKYVNDLKLYQNCPNDCDFEGIQNSVAKRLSAEKFKHTLGVVETAVSLASIHNIDLCKAYISALLHDYAKEFTHEEKLALCKQFEMPLNSFYERNVGILHGKLSAEFAKREFGITDIEILRAISNHTTGRIGMTDLEQLILISDAIEPYREHYDILEELRTLSVANLRQANILFMRSQIKMLKEAGREVDSTGIDALKWLESS